MPEEAILVTGVGGFIASHLAKLLLENGYRIRGTVRSLENAAKVEPLKNLVPDAQYPIELVEVDLTKDDGWDKALEGCTTLMHTASPFPNVAEHTVQEEDLVGPAKEGTLRVLKAAVKAKVKKVILTSSIASVFAESMGEPDKVYTEEDWSNPDSPTIDAYSKSKVLAEKAAWDFQKELADEEKFDLVVINPAFVLGPVLIEAHKNGTSVSFLTEIMNKTYPAVPRLALNFCDVRDVAKAHMKALTVPEAVGKRHIICTDNLWMKDISAIVAKEFKPQGYSIPSGQLPYFVCWLAGWFNKSVKTYVLPRIGKTFKLNNKRMVEVLGIQPTPIEDTVNDMAYSLVDLGIVKKAKRYKQVGSRAEVSTAKEEEKDTSPLKTANNELEPEDKEDAVEKEAERKGEETKVKEVSVEN